MPQIQEPINLMFLGKYDLSQTNGTLNLIQSLLIALSELIHLNFSIIKPSRRDFISLVIVFPVVCYGIFIFLPAGKKVFIITSLVFGIIVTLVKQALFLYYSFRRHLEESHTQVETPPEIPVQTPTQPPLSA